MQKLTPNEIRSLAKKMRLQALDMAFGVGDKGSHLGGGLSTIEIFATLYGNVLNHNSDDALNPNRDRVIISKGHCVLGYYTALFNFGYLSQADIDSFEQNATSLHGHATRNLQRGIEFSGGSLAMGLPFAVGIAMSLKSRKISSHVYVIVGDGECDEGSIWEALMCAAHYKLDNLTVIVDNNKLQYDGPTTEVMNQYSLSTKIASFGFKTIEVDGHNVEDLLSAFGTIIEQPKAIIAQTVKGKGVSFMENVKQWHHSSLSKSQYEQAIEEVKTQ